VFGYNSGVNEISNNQVMWNQAVDEGAGVFIGAEVPPPGQTLSIGTGPSTAVYNVVANLIQGNYASDDGGGFRILTGGVPTFNLINNIIVDNLSAHMGAGISFDDSPKVNIVYNTIANNWNTGTGAAVQAFASYPAGIQAAQLSKALADSLKIGITASPPKLANNIVYNNLCGVWRDGKVTGLGEIPGETLNKWDVGYNDLSLGRLNISASVLSSSTGVTLLDGSVTNEVPPFVSDLNPDVTFMAWGGPLNGAPGSFFVTVPAPGKFGNFHLASNPSHTVPTALRSPFGLTVNVDFDGQDRTGRYNIGADEYAQTWWA
jgi:hypothetical protein